jgi:hypothetical protein
MPDNLLQEIKELAKEILNECHNREIHDLVPLFQRVLHLSQLIKNRSMELWALSELEGYQNEKVLQELKNLSQSEVLEYNSLQQLRSFPDDCFLETLKAQFLATGELVVSEPGRATLTMPLKELEMSYLTDREYYKQTYSITAPLSLSLLEKAFTQMKNRIYIFASEIYLRYRLAQNIRGVFDEKINSVNQRLAKLCPAVLKNLNQALEYRVIDKTQALANLKESLKGLAEFLIPIKKEEVLDLSDQFYLSRICQFFDERLAREKADLLKANFRSLITRSGALYKRLKEADKIGENEIEGLIIQTYFLIADALDWCG